MQIESSGVQREFLLHIPETYQHGVSIPLVLNFHGAGSDMERYVASTEMNEKADDAGFIAIHPQAFGNPFASWFIGTNEMTMVDTVFTRDLVEFLQIELSVDNDRIFTAGFSNGGALVNQLGCQLTDVVVAIAPISADVTFTEECSPGLPISVAIIHGVNDPAAPYTRENGNVVGRASAWAAQNGCGLDSIQVYKKGDASAQLWSSCNASTEVILYTIAGLGGGHTWPGASFNNGQSIGLQGFNATDAIWEFFAAHSR